MKIAKPEILLMTVLLLTVTLRLHGYDGIPIPLRERVLLITDRNLYIAGEKILFSAIIQTEAEKNIADSSRVLYIEIISPDGDKIAGNKYLIRKLFSSGYITIPVDLITGGYYLRAYTKFMRNYGPNAYSYTALKIVNAEKSEFQIVADKNNATVSSNSINNYEATGAPFLISSDKSQYNARDTVHLFITESDSPGSDWKELSLSVVPEFSISKNDLNISDIGKLEKREFFYPESRGLSITAKLIDNKTLISLPGARVNLSIIGRGRDFMSMQTDSSGRFYFSLPDYSGYRDLFLSTENTVTADPKILIDNDYCTIPVHLPSNIFSLTQQERKVAYNMAVNVQLESYFKDDSIPVEMINKSESQTFYGKPDEILYLDKYVQMPSLEDYFTELLNLAKVRIRQGKKYFKVLGPQSGFTDLDPLTLVDLVAIDNPSMVLAISPINISRIEIVNQLYVKGDQTYGGIINIISKQGDFAGIDLPSSGVFLRYGFLADNISLSGALNQKKNIPDTRNTLYWEPLLDISKNSTSKLSFTTSDTPGKYQVTLNGINSKGVVIRQNYQIVVVK